MADDLFDRSWSAILHADVCNSFIVVVFESLGMCCTTVSSEERSCSLFIGLLAWIVISETVIL